MEIYVVRHGQTTGDVENRFGGDYDDHLTELGIKEASELAEKIKSFGIEIIFASPKIRAQETAKILQKELKTEIKVVPDLRERNQNGILTGMKREEALKKYPKLVELLKDRFNTIEGAEDYENFRKRVIDAFYQVARSNYKTVAAVTHGGPIRRILAELTKTEKKWDIADCGWLEVNYQNNKASLIKTEGITSGE